MTNTHAITKGFDIKLAGAPAPTLATAPEAALCAVDTAEFPGVKPKVLVEEGQRVLTGQPLFLDKLDRDIHFCSPATGVVKQLVFGERRFLQRVVIEVAPKEEHAGKALPAGADREATITALKQAGLWQLIRQRPLGIVAKASVEPTAIYINGMDSEPLAACPAFATQGRKAELQAGVDLLRRLCKGPIRVALRAAGDHQSDLRDLNHVEVHDFRGPHPSGLVGTHIHAIAPLKAGQVVWCLKAQDLVRLGSWAQTGRYPAHVVVALSGSSAPARQYYRLRQGAALRSLNGNRPFGDDLRVINGTVLNGTAAGGDGFLGFYAHTVTVIPEGAGRRDLFGWMLPQFGKLSASRSVLSWLTPKKEYIVDAQMNGGHRAIVNIGSFDRLSPLDIHPTYLLRAIQANDLEEALKLGLLEVTEEDVALCSFADPCKIDYGSVIRQGLDMFQKEG